VPMWRNLPIVQVRTFGNRLAMNPEIPGFSCFLTIKSVRGDAGEHESDP
jgi:hypothetical protein